jgi:hypothetical protein
LDIPNYQVVRFSDDTKTRTILGESYTNIGQLLYIGDTSSEIRALEQEISLGISGIPSGSVAEILNNNPKGSNIVIYQALIDPATDQLFTGPGNPLTKFRGLVTNYNMEETWDPESRSTTFTIVLQCTSLIASILEKVSGRRTNDSDQQALYPGDLSMSRVSTITRAQFQFGKPGGAMV